MKTSRSMFVRGLGAVITLAAVALCSLNAQAVTVTTLTNAPDFVGSSGPATAGSAEGAWGYTAAGDANFLDLAPASLVSLRPEPAATVSSLISSSASFAPMAPLAAAAPFTTYWLVAASEPRQPQESRPAGVTAPDRAAQATKVAGNEVRGANVGTSQSDAAQPSSREPSSGVLAGFGIAGAAFMTRGRRRKIGSATPSGADRG